MKKVGKILLVIGCIIGIGLAMKKQVSGMYEQLDAVTMVALDYVADGTYEDSAETPLVKVTVTVTVENHTLKDIQLLRHENGQGTPAEAMLPEMLRQNTSEVDTVSGATMSSKAIRAAVRDALAKGAANSVSSQSENNGRSDMNSNLSSIWNRLKADATQGNMTKARIAEQTHHAEQRDFQKTLRVIPEVPLRTQRAPDITV